MITQAAKKILESMKRTERLLAPEPNTLPELGGKGAGVYGLSSNHFTSDTLDELRSQIRNALVCDDREHLEDKDIEACYNCQIDKVLALFTEHSKEVDRLARIDERENMKFIDNDGKETHLPYVQYRYSGDGLLINWEDRTAQLKRNKGEDNE
jgi:hypothetical protein